MTIIEAEYTFIMVLLACAVARFYDYCAADEAYEEDERGNRPPILEKLQHRDESKVVHIDRAYNNGKKITEKQYYDYLSNVKLLYSRSDPSGEFLYQ